MKQVLQSFKTGELKVQELPAPSLRPRGILVQTRASLISAGTERMVLDFAEKNLLQKAKARPDLVRQVVDKVRREGLLPTMEAVQNRLDQSLPLGYSSAGTVIAAGAEAGDFQVGDRVACAGGGYASHAEIVYVPRNLAVKLPEAVTFEAASFVTLGAIALQGVRQSEAALGENVAVIGLGLLGQLTLQLLRAAGCRVFGIDLDPGRVQRALEIGADAAVLNASAVEQGTSFTGGRGFDRVLITADTQSDEPVTMAGELARDRGVVVAVGSVGLEVPRKLYYEKELDLRLSRSYGPGRYDAEYEEKGNDYPYGYVRWTEQRNMQAVVDLLAAGKLSVESLITHRFAIEEAMRAYEVVTGKSGAAFLGVVLTYPEALNYERTIWLPRDKSKAATISSLGRGAAIDCVTLGVLGAGNFANATLLPSIKGMEQLELVGIASANGVSSRAAAERFGFRYCSTDAAQILHDDAINTVAILTRHDRHAPQAIAALEAGKNVFVEKPLALSLQDLGLLEAAYELATEKAASTATSAPLLMVGFNRRFAPLVIELKEQVSKISEPLLINMRVNAGFLPSNHWLHDPAEGGGRLLGEGCHFLDLLLHFAAASPARITTLSLPAAGGYSHDNFVVTVEFANGSIGTVTYASNGDKRFGKELIEIFGGGLAARLDDYHHLIIHHGAKRIERSARLRADKGHRAEWQAIIAHLATGAKTPIAASELFLSTRMTLAAQQSLLAGEAIEFRGESA